jgi:hypothetical protein
MKKPRRSGAKVMLSPLPASAGEALSLPRRRGRAQGGGPGAVSGRPGAMDHNTGSTRLRVDRYHVREPARKSPVEAGQVFPIRGPAQRPWLTVAQVPPKKSSSRGRPTTPVSDQIRACHQSKDRQSPRPHHPGNAIGDSRRGHPMRRRTFIAGLGSAAVGAGATGRPRAAHRRAHAVRRKRS